MLWSGLALYGDWALLALRLLVAAVFFSSGLSHVRDPKKRGDEHRGSVRPSPPFSASPRSRAPSAWRRAS